MKRQKVAVIDQKAAVAATASAALAVVAVIAALWRLILGLQAAGLI
jgi:hypothetical protein